MPKLLSPYYTGNGVRVGYPTLMKSTPKRLNVHSQRKKFVFRTQRHLYSTGWRRGLASGVTQISPDARVCVGSKIPTCWYPQCKILASGALPNANPRCQVFCVAVEYRLYFLPLSALIIFTLTKLVNSG